MRRSGVSYDYLFSSRHDLQWLRSIDTWPSFNASMLQFHGDVRLDCAQRGVVDAERLCHLKTNDKFLWVPARYLREVMHEVLGDRVGDRVLLHELHLRAAG